MCDLTLFDSELKVMEILWREGEITAKRVSLIAADLHQWNKNTTYTVINKLVKKGAILRKSPNFICMALISKGQVQHNEAKKLVDKLYEGSSKLLVSTFIEDERLTTEDLKSLRQLIDEKFGDD